jgi:lipoprotein signal peptidase
MFVRHQLTLGQVIWLVRPVLYVRHVQNGDVLPALVSIAFLALGALMFVVRGFLRPSGSGSSRLLDSVLGLVLGGALANQLEVLIIGSVTDFIGIRTIGVGSAGDLLMDVGLSLGPVAVARFEEGISRRAFNCALVYAVVVAIALVGQPRFELVVMATAVTGIGTAIWLIHLIRGRSQGSTSTSDN